MPPEPEPDLSRRARTIRTICRVVPAIILAIAVLTVAYPLAIDPSRTAELRQSFEACNGGRVAKEVRLQYPSAWDRSTIVFDLRELDARAFELDILHLLMQFGRRIDHLSYDRLSLQSGGREVFTLDHADMARLFRGYTVSDPYWAFQKLPARLRSPDGSRPFPDRSGGAPDTLTRERVEMIKAMERQDMIKVIRTWARYAVVRLPEPFR